MLCPLCKTELAMTDRQGIEIDYCPSCRGVWLDRGELDKIIDRSVQDVPAPAPQRGPVQQPYHGGGDYQHHRKHKKKSLLGELFDF